MDSEGSSLAKGIHLRNLPFYRLIDSISINLATINQIKNPSCYLGADTLNTGHYTPHQLFHTLDHYEECIAVFIHVPDIRLAKVSAVKYESYVFIAVSGSLAKHALQL